MFREMTSSDAQWREIRMVQLLFFRPPQKIQNSPKKPEQPRSKQPSLETNEKDARQTLIISQVIIVA